MHVSKPHPCSSQDSGLNQAEIELYSWLYVYRWTSAESVLDPYVYVCAVGYLQEKQDATQITTQAVCLSVCLCAHNDFQWAHSLQTCVMFFYTAIIGKVSALPPRTSRNTQKQTIAENCPWLSFRLQFQMNPHLHSTCVGAVARRYRMNTWIPYG